MQSQFPLEKIKPLRDELKSHPIYKEITNLDLLKRFMERHIYSVWDFMSLAKAVQHEIAPSGPPWTPKSPSDIQRFVNEIVLEEETDELPDQSGWISHYGLYVLAMKEIGADTSTVEAFVKRVKARGFDAGFALDPPDSSARFMKTTYGFIRSGNPHEVAAAFALGREHIIPTMFRSLLENMEISKEEAPFFHYYLERHIHLDQDHHGPMSMKTLTYLCRDESKRIKEAEEAAIKAVQARIRFWDDVRKEIIR